MSVPASNWFKTESADEGEILELAARMAETHRLRAHPLRPPQNFVNLLNYFNGGAAPQPQLAVRSPGSSTASPPTAGAAPLAAAPPAPDDFHTDLGDEESIRGRFGWSSESTADVPYIIRNGERFCAVRIVEMAMLDSYHANLNPDISQLVCVQSHYVTVAECKLLNEINAHHCDYQYGREPFTLRDVIVSLRDTREFFRFMTTCYHRILNDGKRATERCGFVKINGDSVVPYTAVGADRYVPLFYFEGETETLHRQAIRLEGWDLTYLKFCCRVQGIRSELFAQDACAVIALAAVREHFPADTVFEEYWPSSVVNARLMDNRTMGARLMGVWTRLPTSPPMEVAGGWSSPSPRPATQAKAMPATVQFRYGSMWRETYEVLQRQQSSLAPSMNYDQLVQPHAGGAMRASTSYATANARQMAPYYGRVPQATPPLMRPLQPGPYVSPSTPPNYGLMLSDPLYPQRPLPQHPPPKYSALPLTRPYVNRGPAFDYDVPQFRGHYMTSATATAATAAADFVRLPEPPVYGNPQPAHQPLSHNYNYGMVPNPVAYYPPTE